MISDLVRFVGILVLLCILVSLVVLFVMLCFKLWRKPSVRQRLDRVLTRLFHSRIGAIIRKIQFQMVLFFGISVLAFMIATNISNLILGKVISSATVDYSQSVGQLDNDTQAIANEIANPSFRAGGNNQLLSIQEAINDYSGQQNERIYVLNTSGKVLMESANADLTQVSMPKLISQASSMALGASSYAGGTIIRMDPIMYQGANAYVVVEGAPVPNMVYTRENNPLSNVIGLAVFILTFYQLTKRKVRYIQELSRGLHEIATGKLDFRVTRRGYDELATLANDMNHTAQALQQQLESERLAEKTKNELITNVSHDLRTPLTLVMGYLRLLKDRKFENDEQSHGFVNIAYDKSEKLSNLIENLFEYTKLSNHGVRFDYQDITINELLGQVVEEMVTVAAGAEVQFIREMSDERLIVHVDANQMSRVFENLLNNSIQYSLKPADVYVRLRREDQHAVITVSNQWDPIPSDELVSLFERFYRGDHARTSAKGGSGLGLAIAKSIVDLHNGSIHAESDDTEIRFVVKLPLSNIEYQFL